MPADYYSKTLTASQVSRAGRGLGVTQVSPSCSYKPVSLRKVRNLSGLYLPSVQWASSPSLGLLASAGELMTFRIVESLPTEDSCYSSGGIRNGWFSGEQRRKPSVTCYLPVKHFKIEVRKVEDGLGRMEVVVILHTYSSFPTVQHSCLHHLASAVR